eukprot:3159070-Amphidinium_carterae.1
MFQHPCNNLVADIGCSVSISDNSSMNRWPARRVQDASWLGTHNVDDEMFEEGMGSFNSTANGATLAVTPVRLFIHTGTPQLGPECRSRVGGLPSERHQSTHLAELLASAHGNILRVLDEV